MKNVIILLFFFYSAAAFSQKFLIDSEEDEDLGIGLPKKAFVRSKEGLNYSEKKHWFSINPIVGQRSYDLSSQSGHETNYSTIQKGGNLAFYFQLTPVISVGVKASYLSFTYSDLGGNVSPSKIKGSEVAVDIYQDFAIYNSSFWGEFSIQMGYLNNSEKHDHSSPLQLTDQKYQALGAGFSIFKEYNSGSSLLVNISIYPSFHHEEAPLSTGVLEHNLLYRWNFEYVYPLSKSFGLSLGHNGKIQSLSFSGTGSRGFSEAKISHSYYNVTVGLRYAY